jgi:hypothetical protein
LYELCYPALIYFHFSKKKKKRIGGMVAVDGKQRTKIEKGEICGRKKIT